MINHHLLLVFSTIAVYEFANFVRLKNIILSNILIYKKIINLFKLKNVSDLKREKFILVYSKILFVSSIKLLIILIFISIFIMCLSFFSNNYLNILFSFLGLLEILIVIVIYYFLRKKYAQL